MTFQLASAQSENRWLNAKNRLFQLLSALIVLLLTCFSSMPVRADDFNSNGVNIHYVVEGKGEPVILVHGLYSSARMNWQMPGTVDQLAKHFMVIAFDNRGHGQSGKPTEDDQYGEQMSEDVVRLMDHLHITQAKVVGYSLGAFIVMKLLTTHPSRVKAAVLCGAGWLQSGSVLDRFFERMPVRGKQLVPPACVHGVARLGTTGDEVKAIKVPVFLIAGDRDPCERMYIAPLKHVRPDWPECRIPDAGHLNCIFKQEFKDRLSEVLSTH